MFIILGELTGLSCLQIYFVNVHRVFLVALSNCVSFVALTDQITSQTVIETYHLLFETMSFYPLTFYSLHDYVIQVVSVSDA